MKTIMQTGIMGEIIMRSLADREFRDRLIHDPATTFRECGIELPENLTVNVVENTENILNIVLPTIPSEQVLSEEYLSEVAASSFCDGVWRGRAAGDNFCECCGPDWGIS